MADLLMIAAERKEQQRAEWRQQYAKFVHAMAVGSTMDTEAIDAFNDVHAKLGKNEEQTRADIGTVRKAIDLAAKAAGLDEAKKEAERAAQICDKELPGARSKLEKIQTRINEIVSRHTLCQRALGEVVAAVDDLANLRRLNWSILGLPDPASAPRTRSVQKVLGSLGPTTGLEPFEILMDGIDNRAIPLVIGPGQTEAEFNALQAEALAMRESGKPARYLISHADAERIKSNRALVMFSEDRYPDEFDVDAYFWVDAPWQAPGTAAALAKKLKRRLSIGRVKEKQIQFRDDIYAQQKLSKQLADIERDFA